MIRIRAPNNIPSPTADVLRVPPISAHGNLMEIMALFGGAEQLRAAVNELQANLYTA
ncbi:MAG: hypothetical protein NTU53_16225 [Planctomycetota bacterium]|nr:hypothetical protein [Planctomycetota bacterium]